MVVVKPKKATARGRSHSSTDFYIFYTPFEDSLVSSQAISSDDAPHLQEGGPYIQSVSKRTSQLCLYPPLHPTAAMWVRNGFKFEFFFYDD